jgi:hypothetical protein
MGSRESRSRMREACGGCKMKKEYYEEKETKTQNNYLEKKEQKETNKTNEINETKGKSGPCCQCNIKIDKIENNFNLIKI